MVGLPHREVELPATLLTGSPCGPVLPLAVTRDDPGEETATMLIRRTAIGLVLALLVVLPVIRSIRQVSS